MNGNGSRQMLQGMCAYTTVNPNHHPMPIMNVEQAPRQNPYPNVSSSTSHLHLATQEGTVGTMQPNDMQPMVDQTSAIEAAECLSDFTTVLIEQDEALSGNQGVGSLYPAGMEREASENNVLMNCHDASLNIVDATTASDEVDKRSVFVGNVDYGATPLELQEHFKICGSINRITVMVDRYTGHPKGYAYIEFQDESAVPQAVMLSDSIFRDRPLKVTPKRKNIPGYTALTSTGGMRSSSFRPAPYHSKFGRGYVPYSTRGRRGMHGMSPYFSLYRGRGQRPYGPY